jgi:hypothetical protein
MSRSKKITIVVVFITLLIGALLLFLEFGEQASDPDQPGDRNPIFPYATSSGFFNVDEDDQINTDNDNTIGDNPPQLWRISDDPVAESRWVDPKDSDGSFWFIKQKNGFVFSVDPDTREVNQLTDSRIPQVREATIGPEGETAIYRYLGDNETIQTYKARFEKTADGTYEVGGSFLVPGIYAIALSPSGDRIFYLQESDNQTVGVIHDVVSGDNRQVFFSDVSNWRVEFSDSNTVTIFTPPADDVTGYGYNLNLDSGNKTKITESTGLVLRPNSDGSQMLASRQADDRFTTNVRTDTGVEFTTPTFADKCSWTDTKIFLCGVPENGNLQSITDWYQGRIQLTDNLVIFNTESGNRDSLFDADQIDKASADITNTSVGNGFQHAVFIDRTTGDLWGFVL